MEIIKGGETFMLIPTSVIRVCIAIDILIRMRKKEQDLFKK